MRVTRTLQCHLSRILHQYGPILSLYIYTHIEKGTRTASSQSMSFFMPAALWLRLAVGRVAHALAKSDSQAPKPPHEAHEDEGH